MYVRICMCKLTYVYVYVCTYMHAHTHIHMHCIGRTGGEALVPLLEECMPAFRIVSDSNKDADVRSSLLVLLDFLLSESGVQHHMHRFGTLLLTDVVVPLCVWRAGKVRMIYIYIYIYIYIHTCAYVCI
jgi:hypothetical protein